MNRPANPVPCPFEALIFDLDGTLVDSAPDICNAANRALGANGRRELTLEEVKVLIGKGARELIKRALELTGAPGTEEKIDQIHQAFIATYADHPADNTTVFPGVIEALENLEADGVAMGLCTNKPTKTTPPVLDALGLTRFFKVVSCGDAVPHKKPDGRHVRLVVEELGATVETSVMVGDSENDIFAAIDAGVKSIAVTFGYAHAPAEELGANALIDHFDKLPEALLKIAGAPANP